MAAVSALHEPQTHKQTLIAMYALVIQGEAQHCVREHGSE